MKSNTFKEYIQPVVVLVAICLVITFALAYVNSITAPIIADNTKRSQDAARAELQMCIRDSYGGVVITLLVKKLPRRGDDPALGVF